MRFFTIFTFLIQTIMCEYDRRIITTLKHSKYTVVPTIVNGKPAVLGQVPYLVSFKEPVQRMEPGNTVWKNICGGSIIDKERVLTAAHCFENDKFYYARNPHILRVVAGDLSNDIVHSGVTETTEQAQWRKIKKVVIHKHFSFPNDDIALVFVDVPWEFTEKVGFINLARRDADYTHECLAAGYGRIGHSLRDTISPVLLTAHITTIPRWRCSLLYEINMNSFICTESALSDVARGDSGGPLICYDDSTKLNDKGVLVGVVSGKNYDKTTLYTRVSAYRDWIINDGVDKLGVNVYLAIILFILIYLLFYYIFFSKK